MELEINHFHKTECNQKFNPKNIRMAVWLYGAIFLIKEGEVADDNSSAAYIGITCPKCLNTILYRCSKQELFSFRKKLNSAQEVVKLGKTPKGQVTVEPVYSFEPSLRYYAPFALNNEIPDQAHFFSLGFHNSENFHNALQDYRDQELFDPKNLFCSFIPEDAQLMGGFNNILWFREEDIPRLVAYENEKKMRVFPRYTYQTELITKIDSLLSFHYINGKDFDRAISDYEREMQETLDQLRGYARENNLNFENLAESNGLIEPEVFANQVQNIQKKMEVDPVIPSLFLEILTLEPGPLGESWYQSHCDYLWASTDPYKRKELPDYFVDQIDTDEQEPGLLRDEHQKMVARVQENQSKSYTQDFLRKNIVDFLEQYEELIQGNEFSYAHVWKFKESYLNILYEKVNKGLREEVPYAMYREGEGWRIVYEGKPFSGLRGKGFLWIYHIISNPNKKVFYRALHQQFNDDQKQEGEATWDDQLSVSNSDVLSNTGDQEGLKTRVKAYDMLIREREEARSKGDTVKLERKKMELAAFIKFLDEQKEKYELKNGDKELHFPALDYSVSDYKTLNTNIKKNYRDALDILKKTKDAKDLHAHLSKSILKEGDGAFIYRPSEDITWHLD